MNQTSDHPLRFQSANIVHKQARIQSDPLMETKNNEENFFDPLSGSLGLVQSKTADKKNNKAILYNPFENTLETRNNNMLSSKNNVSMGKSVLIKDDKGLDPLSRNSTLASSMVMMDSKSSSIIDPLNRSSTTVSNAKKSDDRASLKPSASTTDKKDDEMSMIDDDEDDDKNLINNLEEFKTAAASNVWDDEMRPNFVKTFNPKNLERLKIRNVKKKLKF